MTASYRLNGLLSFRKAGAAFLIPCFTIGNSNAAFTQEVDEQGVITRFLLIGADRYYCDPYIPSGIARRVGDEGVFAVRLNDGKIHYGGFEALRAELVAVDLGQLGSPFFNIDALAFIGDLVGRDRAVITASKLFHSSRVGREWRRLEKRGRVAGLERLNRDSGKGFADKATRFAPEKSNKAKDTFRRKVAHAVSDRLGMSLIRRRGSSFESEDGSVRAVVLTSRPYHRDYQAYWYGFYDTQRNYLAQAASSYLVLSGADTGRIWAIPASVIEPFLPAMSMTKRLNGQLYWHVITKLVEDSCVLVAGSRELDMATYEV